MRKRRLSFKVKPGMEQNHTNLLWNKSLSRLPANTCSAFYPVQMPTSSLLGILLFHEVLTGSFLAGTLLIAAGVLVCLAG